MRLSVLVGRSNFHAGWKKTSLDLFVQERTFLSREIEMKHAAHVDRPIVVLISFHVNNTDRSSIAGELQ